MKVYVVYEHLDVDEAEHDYCTSWEDLTPNERCPLYGFTTNPEVIKCFEYTRDSKRYIIKKIKMTDNEFRDFVHRNKTKEIMLINLKDVNNDDIPVATTDAENNSVEDTVSMLEQDCIDICYTMPVSWDKFKTKYRTALDILGISSYQLLSGSIEEVERACDMMSYGCTSDGISGIQYTISDYEAFISNNLDKMKEK